MQITKLYGAGNDPGHCRSQSSRLGAEINTVTLHYTKGGDALHTAKWAMEAGRGSAHFYVSRSGVIYQAVPLDMRAWHHGKSTWDSLDGGPTHTRTDRCAVGIEMANYGAMVPEGSRLRYARGAHGLARRDVDATRAQLEFNSGTHKRPWMPTDPMFIGKEIWWENYPPEQVNAVVALVAWLSEKYQVPFHRIIGHEDVAAPLGRKQDPGPTWHWNDFFVKLSERTGKVLPVDLWRHHKTVITG